MRFHADYLRRDFIAYGSGGGGDTTVTNQTNLPAWLQAGAQQNLDAANAVADTPYQAYTGQTVAPLTADQQTAYDYVRNNLGTGAAAINAAAAPITGSNLTATTQSLLNPYLGQVESDAVGQVQRSGDLAQNQLNAQAASAGAYGGTRFGVQSGVLAGETARQAGELANTIQSQGWNTAVSTALGQAQEVGNLATSAQTAGLDSASALSSAGAQQQNQQQAQINAMIQQWQQAQNYPLQQLAIRESALTSTPYGASSSSSQPLNQANPLIAAGAGALGGAASGAALGATIGSGFPGIGTAFGALAGAGLGYLGSRR